MNILGYPKILIPQGVTKKIEKKNQERDDGGPTYSRGQREEKNFDGLFSLSKSLL